MQSYKEKQRDKKAFLSDQCKEIEENNRMGKTRDLFKKMRDTKQGNISCSVKESEVAQSCSTSRQEYWSGLPFPSLGDLPDPGIEPRSPSLQADALPSEPPGKPQRNLKREAPCCAIVVTML